MTTTLAPSDLDYAPLKCKRCFYLKKKEKLSPGGFPPPVFSNFDVVQKDYFKTLSTKDLTNDLPEGRFLQKDELPGRIVSRELEDLKKRKFILGGTPDIVIKFKDNSYGILDFKTTNLSETKSQNYKYQLEAYAQIFTFPGAIKSGETPKLEPITHLGILQFFPKKITSHAEDNANLQMQMSYSPLVRDIDNFYKHITFVIDILNADKIPNFSDECEQCSFTEKSSKL
jgi:hypothetical protein